MKNQKINYAAVGVCFVVLFLQGFLWYSVIFDEIWMSMVGTDLATVEANPAGAGVWITNIISTILPIYFLAWLFKRMSVNTGMEGAMIGFFLTFTFVLLSDMTGGMFSGDPYGLAWITGGFYVVGYSIVGFILGTWTKYEVGEGEGEG